MSLHDDEGAAGFSNSLAYPREGREPAARTKTQNLIKSIVVLFGVVIVLIALGRTELEQSIKNTVERVGRSITVEGQLSAQWFKAKANNQ